MVVYVKAPTILAVIHEKIDHRDAFVIIQHAQALMQKIGEADLLFDGEPVLRDKGRQHEMIIKQCFLEGFGNEVYENFALSILA